VNEDWVKREMQIKGGSLATILQQALVSEDGEQLDWLLLSESHSDQTMIDKTVYQIKEQHLVGLLVKKILEKFQTYQSKNLQTLSLWLKSVLKIHWHWLVGESGEVMGDLVSLKKLIEEKQKNLGQILQVKGKLEMVKNTFQMQELSQKYWKIKRNISKAKEETQKTLVYKDASDDEKDIEGMMERKQDEYFEEEDSDDFDEEI
jgi:hypothetical protein